MAYLSKSNLPHVRPRPFATGVLLVASVYGFYKAGRSAGEWYDVFSKSVSDHVSWAIVATRVMQGTDEEDDE